MREILGGQQKVTGGACGCDAASQRELDHAKTRATQQHGGMFITGDTDTLRDVLLHFVNQGIGRRPVTSSNIAEIREALYIPGDGMWNDIVREETARRAAAFTAAGFLTTEELLRDTDDAKGYAGAVQQATVDAAEEAARLYSEERNDIRKAREVIADMMPAPAPVDRRTFNVRMSAQAIRDIAAAYPCSDAELRYQVPMAFIGDIVSLDVDDMLAGPWFGWFTKGGPTVYMETEGAHKGLGLHLDESYQWEIVPSAQGIGSTLIARRKF